MSQHKALVTLSKGAKFIVSTHQTPEPGRDQVLVKVFAVVLNPVDVWIEKYGSFMEKFPAVAGSDGAGTIEEIGEGVTNWSKGERVVLPGAFFSADRGTFQQFAIADASRVAKIPESITFEEAATVPLGLSTAAVGTYSKKRPEKGGAELTAPWTSAGRGKYHGQPAVVLGDSSSVGQYALQLLKLSGFSPIISTASAANEVYCKAAGATHFIDYRTTSYEDLPAAVASISSVPVTFVYDAISVESSQEVGWQILAAGGSTVVTLSPLVNSSKQGEGEDGKRLVCVGANVNREENHEIGDSLYAVACPRRERLRIEVLHRGLEAIPAGLERLRKNEVSGVKLIALPWETA